MTLRPSLLLLSLLLPCGVASTQAQTKDPATPAPLLIEYRHKPPYFSTVNGRPVGLLIDKTVQALEAAGVRYRMAEVPAKRIMSDIEADAQAVCSPGWYRIPARERFARFSRPIHRDLPQLLLASPASAARVRAAGSLQALLQDRELRLLLVDGVSYGPGFDTLIRAMPGQASRHTVTPLELARMLEAGRGDYMIIDQEDLGEYVRRPLRDTGSERAQPIEFADLPPGLERHLICSRSVSPTVIERIDAAIQRLGLDAGDAPAVERPQSR